MLILGVLKDTVVLDETPCKFAVEHATFQFYPTFYREDAVSKFLRVVADFLPECEVPRIYSGGNPSVACVLSFRQRRGAHVAVVDIKLVCLWHALYLCSVDI